MAAFSNGNQVSTMIKRITLLGSSSGRNAGDAALIGSIMDSVDETLGRRITYEIPTICPSYITDQYDNDTVPIGMMPWHASVKMLGIPTYRSVMRTDLTLIFDAILFDRSLYNPLFNFMWTLDKILPAAKKKGKQFGYFNVGTGPVNTPAGKAILRRLSDQADFITTRDIASEGILAEVGVTNPLRVITADAAVRLKASPEERVREIYQEIGLDPDQEILAINVNRYIDTWADDGKRESMGAEKFSDTFAKAIDIVVKELNVPVLFVNTQHHDVPIAQAVVDKMQKLTPTKLCNNTTYNHYEIKGVLGKASLLFGMRLHANILGSSAMTPIVGLNYQPKVKFYFDLLGLDEYTMSFDNFSVEGLAAHMQKGWAERDHIRGLLEERIPRLQARAHSPAQFVKAVDEGSSLAAVADSLKANPIPVI
ncbi:MAG: polysaccharide pyruvyl transferase WcaK-like protein [Verrucomicrobiales bacterium]